MKKYQVIIFVIFGIIFVVLSGAFIFIKLYKPFGASPNSEDKKDYSLRSKNYKDGSFYNDGDFSVMTDWSDPYADRTTGKDTKPIEELPSVMYSYQKPKYDDDVFVTWFGHSSVLLQMHKMNILIDPVFDDVASPVSFIGPKRFSEAPVEIKDLPDIDMVVLTHDHYDHESYKTLLDLNSKTKKFIVPLGIEKDLEKFGIEKDKITNMAWWEEIEVDGLKVVCTPARHYTGRYLLDSNDTLWASWLFIDEYNKVYDSGDTGYGDHFKQIKEKYGDITLSLLDGAQYDEKWHDVHMFPEEAVMAAQDLNSDLAMVVHYGAFVLSNHSWDDPVDRFTRFAKEKSLNYISPILGQTANIKEFQNFQKNWWKKVK